MPTSGPGQRHGAIRVIAVVVGDSASVYLDDTIAALGAQQRPPDRIVVVDIGDDSAIPSTRLPSGAEVVRVPAATFGAAVAAAVDHVADGERSTDRSFIWLLHDDSAPAPSALAAQLAAVSRSDAIAVAGAKQTDETGTYLREVGVTISRFGRRMTDLDDEVDQGQHDDREDVFAVGAAGMLVRHDVWVALGGFDPALGPYLDGMDFSRRARLAGHRVIVVPDAIVRHAQAGFTGARQGQAQPPEPHGARDGEPGSRSSFLARRRAFVHTQLAWVPLPLVPIVMVAAVIASMLRSLMRLATKEMSLVGAELAAPWLAFARPAAIWSARRRLARTSRLPRRSLRRLQRTYADVFRGLRDRQRDRRAARRTGPRLNPLEVADRMEAARRRRFAFGGLVVVLAAMTVVLQAPLITGGTPVGGALLSTDADAGDLWAALVTGWHAAGLGAAAPIDPLLVVLLPLAAATGSLQSAVSVVYLGSVMAAGLAAWFAAGAVTRSTGLRFWAAIVWAAAPVLQTATSSGRLGSLVVHMTLPLAALAMARALGPVATDPGSRFRPTGSIAAAAAAGLLLAPAAAAAPILLPVVVVLVLVLLIALPRSVPIRHRARLLLVPVPALVLLIPVLVKAIGDPRLLLADVGRPVPSGDGPLAAVGWSDTSGWLATWSIAGQPLARWLLPATMVVVLAAALLAFFRGGRAVPVVRVGWLVAALGMLAAGLAGATATSVGATGDATALLSVIVTGSGEPGVSLALLGLLAAVVAAGDGLRTRLSVYSFGWRQLGGLALSVVAVLAVVATTATWLVTVRTADAGTAGASAVVAADGATVPAVAVDAQRSDGARTLTLVVDAAGAVRAEVLRGPSADLADQSIVLQAGQLTGSLADARMTEPDDADEALADVVAELVAATGADLSAELAELGIGAVLLPPQGDPASRDRLAVGLDTADGLQRVVANQQGTLWWVAPEGDSSPTGAQRIAGMRLTDLDGRQLDAVPAGREAGTYTVASDTEWRHLVLAERADANWRAEIDGVALEPVDAGWAQAFDVSSHTGKLTVEYRTPYQGGWLVALGVVLLLMVLLAVPFRRRSDAEYLPFPVIEPDARGDDGVDGSDPDMDDGPVGGADATTGHEIDRSDLADDAQDESRTSAPAATATDAVGSAADSPPEVNQGPPTTRRELRRQRAQRDPEEGRDD